MNNFIFKIDHYVAQLFHKLYLFGGNVANIIMEYISYLAEAGILFLLIGVGLALFKRTRKIGTTILVAVAIGFLLTNVILKNAVSRARPFKDFSSDFYKWWLDAGATYEGGYSFPSGHTTATTAFAIAIFLTTNKERSWWILLLPIFMAFSRIYLMVHYFTDCLGGLIVGSVAGIIAFIIIKLIYSSKAKFFVWVREFDIFHPKSITSTKKEPPLKNEKEENKPADKFEDFVYIPMDEEQNLKQTQNIDNSNKENNNLK